MREPLSKQTRSRSSSSKTAHSTRTVARPKARTSSPKGTVSRHSATPKLVKKVRASKKSVSKVSKASTKKKITVRAEAVRKSTKSALKAKSPKKALRKKAPSAHAKLRRSVSKAPARIIEHAAPPIPELPRRQVASGVLRAFEQAVKTFNRRQFPKAKELFENLQRRYPQEVEINARVQTYIQICNQKLVRQSQSPRNADELYDRGVIALNIGDFTQARTLFEKALRLRPNEPHLLYSLAATHAKTGSPDQALDYLYRSIQIQPRYRAQAMNDTDFTGLHGNKRFLEILGISSPFDLLESQR